MSESEGIATEPVVDMPAEPTVDGSPDVNAVVDKELNDSPVKPPSNKAISEDGDGDDISESDAPPEVKRRVKALKRIQVEVARTESHFFKEMHELEMKYANKYTDYYEKRKEIVLGKYEPTDDECVFNCSGVEEEGAGAEAKAPLVDGNLNEGIITGIPDFWLTIFQNVEMLSEMIQPHDIPIIKHLTDIKVEMTTKPMGFELMFHFSPNDYFANAMLTKTYEMKCEVDSEDPFSFEGPEIVKCAGCHIDWHEGKNVTVRVVRKKQKHKQTGSVRMVNKSVEVPSFFEFFAPPPVEEGVELDEDLQLKLTNHFEVGQYIRERIVPRAVLYYTGEALEDEDEDDDDYDDEDDDDETEGEENASGASSVNGNDAD